MSKVYGLRLAPSEVDRLPELLRDNSVAIGWSHAVDLKNHALDKSGFRTELETTYPGLKGHALSIATNDTWRFLREMEIGDILVIPHGDDIHFAKVTSKARHVPQDLSKDTVFQRDVARLLDGKPRRRHDLPLDLQTALKFRNTTADLSRVGAEVNDVIGSDTGKPLKARETKFGIRSGLKAWEAAFKAIGRNDHGFSKEMFWVDDLAIWLLVNSWKRDGGIRHWNGLGDRLAGAQDRNLIVEVNPPDGGPPGRWQGMVASDENGRDWLLHSGEINAGSRRAQLKDELDSSRLPVRQVAFADGSVRDYFVVAHLDGNARSITRQTKRFVDVCVLIRSKYQSHSNAVLDAKRRVQRFEESIGTTIVPPQPQKEIDRLHARIWHDLRDALEAKDFHVDSERVSALGPDLFTLCEANPYLFELKTGAGASDCLKGVGQLIVYEMVLSRKYRKILVVPGNVGEAFIPVLKELDIGVASYKIRDGKYEFSWPEGFPAKAARSTSEGRGY